VYQTNSVAFSTQAEYTDWATGTCWPNLVLTFTDRVLSRGQRGGPPTVVDISFLDRRRYCFSSSSSCILTRAQWTPFQTHCYPDNLAASEIEQTTFNDKARDAISTDRCRRFQSLRALKFCESEIGSNDRGPDEDEEREGKSSGRNWYIIK
jgi:hypothetical protein